MTWNRSAKWIKFAENMPSHLLHYCDEQYPTTDPDNDLDNWTIEDVKAHMKTYVGRIGSTQRGSEQAKEDMIKLAHFASIIWNKLNEE
jgi:hypothetical protein